MGEAMKMLKIYVSNTDKLPKGCLMVTQNVDVVLQKQGVI